MAAAALLRSMARKLARAPPPPHHRHILSRGVHGGASSGHGGSLPPLSINQIRQGSRDPLAVSMAAAAGLRPGAALPSLAGKIARAPPPPHHRHILNRGVHSSTTATPTTDKDKIIENLRLRLWYARASAGIGGFMLTAFSIYCYFWLLPAVEKERARLQLHAKKLKPGYELPNVSLAQIIAIQEHRKQQRNGTMDKGTMADKVQAEIPIAMEVCLDVLKETTASLKDVRAELKESRAAVERILNVAPSKPKEGCSRVGSETLTPTS